MYISPRARKIGLAVGVVVVILAVLFLVWFLTRPEPAPAPPQDIEEVPNQEISKEPIRNSLDDSRQEERIGSAGIQSLARSFSARYGSYSTDTSGENLRDVLPLMTEGFASATRQEISQLESRVFDAYYGVSTRVVSIAVENMDESAGVATLRVSTQREESIDSPQNTSLRYQDLVLNFEKVGDVWLVSGAEWQE